LFDADPDYDKYVNGSLEATPEPPIVTPINDEGIATLVTDRSVG